LKNLVIFIHGIGGSATGTWGKFPNLVLGDTELANKFDVDMFEYKTGFLSAVPPLTEVARELASYIEIKQKNHKEVVLIAHSQGGLIAQRYICDVLALDPHVPLTIARLLTFASATWLFRSRRGSATC
jgi:pimeloyl-ACP methyl ester carboxylesterase